MHVVCVGGKSWEGSDLLLALVHLQRISGRSTPKAFAIPLSFRRAAVVLAIEFASTVPVHPWVTAMAMCELLLFDLSLLNLTILGCLF